MSSSYRGLGVLAFGSALTAGAIACTARDTTEGSSSQISLASQHAAASDDAGTVKSGAVQLSTGRSPSGPRFTTAAMFLDQPPPSGEIPGCEVQRTGSCTLRKCETPTGGGGDPPARMVSAGDIEISGARIVPPLELIPRPSGFYPFLDGDELLWDGGEMIRFKAGGSTPDGPTFVATLRAPMTHVDIARPSWSEGTPLIVSRETDLDVQWWYEGEAQSNLVAYARSQEWDGPGSIMKNTSVECEFPVAAQSGTIPSSLLRAFRSGAQGGFGISLETTEVVQPPGWHITLHLISSPTSGKGTGYGSTAATFQ